MRRPATYAFFGDFSSAAVLTSQLYFVISKNYDAFKYETSSAGRKRRNKRNNEKSKKSFFFSGIFGSKDPLPPWISFALCTKRNRLTFAAGHLAPLSLLCHFRPVANVVANVVDLKIRSRSCWSSSFLLFKLCFHGKRRPAPLPHHVLFFLSTGCWLEKS